MLTQSIYWKNYLGLGSVTFENIDSNCILGDACSHQRHVRLTDRADRATLCHEMAHIAAGIKHRSDIKPHGPEWRGYYVEIVRALYGEEYSERLRKIYTNHGEGVRPAPAVQHGALVSLDELLGEVVGGWNRFR